MDSKWTIRRSQSQSIILLDVKLQVYFPFLLDFTTFLSTSLGYTWHDGSLFCSGDPCESSLITRLTLLRDIPVKQSIRPNFTWQLHSSLSEYTFPVIF
jgi:hypothetical protein